MLFYAGVQVVRVALQAAVRGLGTDHERDRKFYKKQRLPVFAPPTVAFPIAWSINSVAAISGGLHVLNLPPHTEGRTEFLRLQAAAWALFASFETAYFGLRSPINAALVTYAYTAVTAASLDIAWRRMHDRTAVLSLAPTAVWLTLAHPVGTLQAVWNYDPFWKVGPLAEPQKRWLKNR